MHSQINVKNEMYKYLTQLLKGITKYNHPDNNNHTVTAGNTLEKQRICTTC